MPFEPKILAALPTAYGFNAQLSPALSSAAQPQHLVLPVKCQQQPNRMTRES